MVVLQALLALITKSAGKILNAIFGWAVHALFGRTTSRDQTLLSALVGAAVAWPLLVAGVVAPKVAALALAFVPLPKSVPSWAVRIVWLALALAVPVVLGLTIAARQPADAPREPVWKKVLRGFPLTLGLALAFLVMFVSVPVMRLVSLVRREKSADIPLVTDTSSYHEVAERVVEALNRHDFQLSSAEPGWWVKAPTRILALFGGTAFAAFVPQKIEHYEGPGLAVSFYTSGVLLRGTGKRQSLAHGLISETVTHSRGLETFSPEAQKLERRIRDVWTSFDEAQGDRATTKALLERVAGLEHDLATTDVPHEDWQALYRQLLQVERVLRGEPQVLDAAAPRALALRGASSPAPRHRPRTARLSTPELMAEVARDVGALVKTQIALAKAELRQDFTDEAKMVAGLGIAALAAFVTLNLLLVTAILALAAVMPAWEAGLTVAGGTLLIAAITGVIGWRKRVRRPLAMTRHEIEEDVTWAKKRLA